jgi:hypothetical protein
MEFIKDTPWTRTYRGISTLFRIVTSWFRLVRVGPQSIFISEKEGLFSF